jgi:glycosyltransferase involved in cell wall biosynthesis
VTWGQSDLGRWLEGLGIPRVLCSHTTLKEAQNYPITGVTHLTAVSEAAMRYFDGRTGLLGLPQTVLYNGADPSRCRSRYSRSEIRARWGLNETAVVVGFLGRQGPEKNPLAPALAVAAGPANYHAIYYGVGPFGNGFCQDTLAWCEANIPRRYRMFPPVFQIGDAIQGFDVLMLASHREAFSLTLNEAWLAGIPVVATPVGSLPELQARFGEMTFRVPLNPSAEELRDAVQQATGVSSRTDVVSRARRIAKEHFTTASMARRWAAYLELVVTDRSPPPLLSNSAEIS